MPPVNPRSCTDFRPSPGLANPRVSVVLPVYNAGKALRAAVQSIVDQTEPDWELVVVDDGSTDSSPRIVAEFAKRDSRVRVLKRAHEGIVSALNAGVQACRGPLVARMDADDVSLPERLSVQAGLLDSHPEIGLAGCRVRYGGDREAQAGYAAHVDWANSLVGPEEIAAARFIESPFPHPSVMFRRSVWERFGTYADGPFPEDYQLWLRWMDRGVRMAKADRELLVWNDPPQRLSRTDPRYSPDAFYACKARYLASWLAAHNPRHPDVVVWGAGRVTRKRAENLTDHGIRIEAYVDISPRAIGQTVHGRPVLAPDELPPPDECFVVPFVANRGARELIRARLQHAGFCELRNFIFAA